jgi:hypothetical protein
VRHPGKILTLERPAAGPPPERPGKPRATAERAVRRYLLVAMAALLLAGTFVFGFNALIDPLWYIGGNKLAPRNFVFDERLAKTNALLAAGPATYDCLVLGSSRLTFLDVRRLRGHRCFNYSFSAGSVADFVAFAAYAKHHGLSPRLVIVGVDAENFANRAVFDTAVPAFVNALAPPPSIWKSYLTLDAYILSLRTFYGASPLLRFYDRDLVVDVPPGQARYKHTPWLRAILLGNSYSAGNVAQYRRLREIFPGARVIGIVPPVSAQVVAGRRDEGSLDGWLEANYAARDVFDALYDFSAPSEITADRRNHYDDSHFSRETYDRVADVLNGEAAPFGLDLATLSRAQYGQAYAEGLARFGEPLAAAPAQ